MKEYTMRTIIYIDAFNLYNGLLKNTSYKWLNLQTLFEKVLPNSCNIIAIKYFTAKIKHTPQRSRQAVYIRALENMIPNFQKYYGYFVRRQTTMRHANPPPNTVSVIKTEEKGSDVNLSVHMLNDAWLDAYDCAVIVSNDGDMAESLKLIKQHHLGKKIIFVPPIDMSDADRRVSQKLAQYADHTRHILQSVLADSQMPDRIPATHITKPNIW